MKRRTWLVVPLAWTALTIGTAGSGGCSASTPAAGGGGSAGSTAQSSGGGGNGGNEASSSSTSSTSNTSSSTSGGGVFAACTDTTGSLGDCKNCCDCAAQLTCEEQRACRDMCNALGDAYFTMNQNPMPVNAPSTLGPGGDYSACTTTVQTEQECKACCDCTVNFVCGDHPYCRNACVAKFSDGGAPPPPKDGG